MKTLCARSRFNSLRPRAMVLFFATIQMMWFYAFFNCATVSFAHKSHFVLIKTKSCTFDIEDLMITMTSQPDTLRELITRYALDTRGPRTPYEQNAMYQVCTRGGCVDSWTSDAPVLVMHVEMCDKWKIDF